jgi:hypothetical protein
VSQRVAAAAPNLDEALEDIRRRPLLRRSASCSPERRHRAAAGAALTSDRGSTRSGARVFFEAAATAGCCGDAAALAACAVTAARRDDARAATAGAEAPRPAWDAPRVNGAARLRALRARRARHGARDARDARGSGARWRLDRAALAFAAHGLDQAASTPPSGARAARPRRAFEDAARRRLAPSACSRASGHPARRRCACTHEGVVARPGAVRGWLALLSAAAAAAVAPTLPTPTAGGADARAQNTGGEARTRDDTPPPSTRDAWLAALGEHARRSGWRTDRLLAPVTAQDAAGGSSPASTSSARP